MMDITNIKLLHLRNGEYIQHPIHYLHILTKYTPDVLGIHPEFDTLNSHLNTMEAIFRQRQNSVFTADIAYLDALGDKHLAGISYMIQSYLRHYDEHKVQAAIRRYLRRLSARLMY